MQTFFNRLSISLGLVTLSGFAACNSVTGLNDFSVGTSSTQQGECTTNADCASLATGAAGESGAGATVCVKPAGHCATVLSDDCTTVTGDPSVENTILLGSLFSTKGATAATNLQRQQSAMLAVQQINAAGGIPASSGSPRKVALISCDESANLDRASKHLVNDLGVPAIIGPNTSQDTLDLSNKVTIPGKTVVMSPSAVASSITALIDNDLTWLMVPTDVQRAPLMLSQLNDLESSVKADRNLSAVKLGVVFRNDALGIGTRTSLNQLTLNGQAISDPVNLGKNVQIDGYDYKAANQDAIVQKYVTFAPDLIVLAGTAEAITAVMVPLEAAWTAPNRPYYMLIDSLRSPELITAVTGNDDLRRRVRGTGLTPGATSAPIYTSFKVDYQVAFPGSSATTSGMGPAYDATYAIAFALAATKDLPVSGTSVAKGLRKLAGGATHIEVGSAKAPVAFQKLASGETIDAIGTFGPLAWDADGAVVGGTIEMWCIGSSSGTPTYQSSGLTFDIASQQKSGQYTQCSP